MPGVEMMGLNWGYSQC